MAIESNLVDFNRRNDNQEMLLEMAMEKSDAIDRCRQKAKPFIKHFHKVVKEGKYSDTFAHHCDKMQSWWDDVRTIKLKNTKKYIDRGMLIDCFFTDAQDVEDIIEEPYQDLYYDFYLTLLTTKNSVQECFEQLLNY